MTLAPEAGTQELRDTINKGVDEEQFDEAVRATFRGGFTGLKLYFMIGLPGETDEDVLGIARMAGAAARLAKEIGKGRARLSIAVSSYVPKPHTPFELEPFAGEDTLRRRQQLLRAALPRGVRVSFHDVGASLVEATLARGGLGTDGWSKRPGAWGALRRLERALRPRRWEGPPRRPGIELGEPAGRRASWRDAVDARLDAAFLAEELERSRAGVLTEDCRDGACGACGVCGEGVEMEIVT